MISSNFTCPESFHHSIVSPQHKPSSPVRIGSPVDSKLLGVRTSLKKGKSPDRHPLQQINGTQTARVRIQKQLSRTTQATGQKNPQVASNLSQVTGPQTVGAQQIDAVPHEKETVQRVSSKPPWFVPLEMGNRFNTEQAPNYSCSELYVDNPERPGSYFRVDSYSPKRKRIVSRKYTQLSEIRKPTALRYVRELPKKYRVGSVIARVPSSKELAGQVLQGQYFLEVPVQINPVPECVIDEASRQKVLIQDTNGTIYQ
jgi:hypothetical protein